LGRCVCVWGGIKYSGRGGLVVDGGSFLGESTLPMGL
jgi:hypothetical protein